MEMMGKRNIATIFLIACITPLVWGSLASATQFGGGKSQYVADSVEINDDLFLGAETINVRGYVRGDLVMVGTSAVFDGEVDGSVMAGAYNFNMAGHCRNSVRVFARSIDIDGRIERNLMAFGENVVLGNSGWVEKDFHAGASTLIIQGRVGGKLRASGGQIYISGQVDGDVDVEAEDVIIQPAAIIGGALKVCGKNEPKIEPGAQILGDISYCVPEEKEEVEEYSLGDFLFDSWSFLALLLTGGIMLAFFRGFTSEAVGLVKSQWLKSLGLGFVFFIALPIAAVVLLVTLVGIPMGLIVLGCWWLLFYLSKVFGGLIIGDLILRKFRLGRPTNLFWALVLGLLIVFLLLKIPVLWVPIKLAMIFLTFGGFFLTAAGRQGRPNSGNGAAIPGPIQ